MELGKRTLENTDFDLSECLKNIRDRHDGDSTSESCSEINEGDPVEEEILSSGDEDNPLTNNTLPPEELAKRRAGIARLYPWVDRMIEESDLTWLDPNDEKLTEEIKQLIYLVGCSMVIKKTCTVPLPTLPIDEFVFGLKSALKRKIIKRKDQMLRMVYGGIIKTLFKKAAAKKGRHPRKHSFLAMYGGENPTALEYHVETCRTPSKKKLIEFFLAFPEIYAEAVELVDTGDCLRASLSKQKRRIEIIINTFLNAREKGGCDLAFTKKEMKETLAHLPWSIKEITGSIDDMIRVFKDVEIWKKIEENQKAGVPNLHDKQMTF